MRFTPHSYQAEAIDRIIQNPAAGLFLDMGLGKTVITLSAVRALKFDRLEVERVLVIAPLTVAQATWTTEAQKWDHLQQLRVVPVLGALAERRRGLRQPADIYVINRENVPWLVEEVGKAWPFDMVVIDESSSFKSPSAKRFKALKSVRKFVRRMVLLSGTPAPNSIADLWAQIFLLDGGRRLGPTITAFRQAYMREKRLPGQQWATYTPKPGADLLVQGKISDICVSMRAADYLELPPFVEAVVPVQLDDKAGRAYKALEHNMLLEAAGAEISATSAAALSGKLLQLCGGAVYAEDGQAITVHDGKLRACMELVEGLQGDHAVIWYWYQHERERLLEALRGTGLRVRCYTGADDGTAWNAGQVDILLAQPAATGYGLNLQEGGHRAIWYTLPAWNLELYQQANKRLHRQGQRQPVVSHILAVKGGMDDDVLAALQGKGDAQDALLAAIRARIAAA